MLTMTRRWSYPVLARFAFGTLFLAGCASFAKSKPPGVGPATPSQTSSQSPALASGDEPEPRGVDADPERESARERRVTTMTMKRFKSVDWPAKTSASSGMDAAGNAASAFGVSGVVTAAGAPPVPEAFAERRASEALDRLGGLVTIRQERRGAVITLSSDRLVDSGRWALTTSGQYSLRELAAGLRDQDGRTIRIQGYTDSLGTAAVNDAVSLRRAEAVRDFLITQGVSAEGMQAEGLGAKRPVAPNGTADGRALNRRIEIVIAPAR